MKKQSLLLLFGLLIISCTENDLQENTLSKETSKTETKNPLDHCLRKIRTLRIDPLNEVGKGFNFMKYFVEDWTGDGIVDIMGLKENGNMYFYKGKAVDEGFIGTNPPNITEDPGRTDWKYKLHPGVLVGTGWNNFKEFYPGDWNGDGILDMMAMRYNNRMYKYIWSGTSFSSGVDVGGPGTGQLWLENRVRYVVNLNDDGKSDLIEMFDEFGDGRMRKIVWNGSDFYSTASSSGYNLNNDYYPFDYNHDGVTDLMVRKPDGKLYFRKGKSGTSFGYYGEKYVGHGWNNFTDIYPGNNWSICKSIASLTGRKANGDLYSYLWSSNLEMFNPGKKVGHGWNTMKHIFTGDVTGDIYYRDDYLGIRYDGKLYAYGTVLELE